MNRCLLSLIFCLSISYASSSAAFAETTETKIGVVISQTGPLAIIGKGIVNAIALASEQKDPKGRVKFIFEDDGLQPARAVSAAEKLIANDHVSALITFAGGSSSALAPIAERKKIPLITIAAGDQHTIGKTYVYRQFISTISQVKLIEDEILRAQLNRIAIVTTSHETLNRLRDLLRESLGSRIAADEEILPADSDMRSLATRIISKQPDAVVLYLLPPQLALFSDAIRNQGYKGPFFGTIQIYNFSQVTASKGALIGTIFPSVAVGGSDGAFHREYQQRFKEPLASEQEVIGYDIAATLIEAAATGDIQKYLQSLKEVRGIAGIYPRRENNFFEVPAVLKRIASENSVEVLQKQSTERHPVVNPP